MKKWKPVLVISILALLAGLYPYNSIVVPTWKLRIVDENGRPYANLAVTQAWKNYSLEIEADQHLDIRSTNADGYVEFPERKLRASGMKRMFLTTLSAVLTLAHGSLGVHAYVHASGPQGYAEVKYQPGEPLPGELILPLGSDEQLLKEVEQFATSDERVSAPAWRILQSRERSKLIEDLTRIKDAAAPDDGNRALIAFTLCALGHEYASNRKIVVSALSRKPPFKNVQGDWAVTLITRLMNGGDYDLLVLLFEVCEWSDGAMTEELASSYSRGLVTNPDTFLRLLSSQSEASRSCVMRLLKFNSFSADENAKVKSYLKNVSRQSKLRPIAEQTINALTN